jgi:two-component system, OmpR family, response regulator
MANKTMNAGKVIVVIDDDPLVRGAIEGLLRGWGYRVVAADSDAAALARLALNRQAADLIVCDYHLSDGKTGIEAIERIRGSREIPAFIITADTARKPLCEARGRGYQVLHKPVAPEELRAALTRSLRKAARSKR